MIDRIDVNFSLALHNRTGKYHIGLAILRDQAKVIGQTYYWRMPSQSPPSGIAAKGLGRLLHMEQQLHRRAGIGRLRGHRTGRPMLHMDPWTVCYSDLQARDIVLCHDMGPITHPDLFADDVTACYRDAYRYIARQGPMLIFVSEMSRAAFVELFGSVAPMRVIYPPIRAEAPDRAMQPIAAIDGAFLLTVGSLGRRKNQLASIRAFAASGLAQRGLRYVLCGSREPGADDVIAAGARTPGVIVLDYVSEAELNWLYASATGFVLMSRLEGFGLPVAEAIANGLVPLVSRDSVLQEVAGPGALYADPDDEAEMAGAMRQLADIDDAGRSARKARMMASLDRFSPERFKDEWSAAIGLAASAAPDHSRAERAIA